MHYVVWTNGKVNSMILAQDYSMRRFLFRSLKDPGLTSWMHTHTHTHTHTHILSINLFTRKCKRNCSLGCFEGWIWFLDDWITMYCFHWVSNWRDRLSRLKHQNRLQVNFLISLPLETIRRIDKYFRKKCSKIMNNQGSG